MKALPLTLLVLTASCYDFEIFDHLDASTHGTDAQNNNGTWTVQTSATQSDLFAVGGYGQECFAAGALGLVHSSDGGKTWGSVTSPTPKNVLTILGNVAGFWLAGNDGIFFRSPSDTAFHLQKNGLSSSVYSIGAASAPDLYAGLSGSVLQFDGTSWSTAMSFSSVVTFEAIAFGTDGNGVAVGSKGTIVRLPELTSATPIFPYDGALWGAANDGDTLYVVGDAGGIFHSTNRTDWVSETAPTTQILRAIVKSGNLLFAVGYGGVILRSTIGSAVWTAEVVPVTQDFHAAWAGENGDVVVVGAAGTILHWP